MATKATKPAKAKKKRAPLRRANNWKSEIPGIAGKLLLITVAVIVLGLMFSALQMVKNALLRDGLSLLIVSGMAMLFYSEGLNKGARDANESRQLAKLEKSGIAIEAREDAACYHPLKALCAALAVFGIPLALAVFVAVTTQPYTYALQDLPAWLTDTYGARGDVMGPLGAYAQQTSLTATDWARLVVRLPEMIYINLFDDPQTMSALIDWLSPLMIATFPLAYVIGYLRGPSLQRKRESMQRRAKKVAVRKASRSSLAAELTGEQPQVHYGHRADSDKPRKKELV